MGSKSVVVRSIVLVFFIIYVLRNNILTTTENPCLSMSCEASSEALLQLVKSMIIPPPSPKAAYHFDQDPPNLEGQYRQPQIIDELLGGKENGFFIECGAYDGEDISNTLYLEMKRNWTGLLIEANPRIFQSLEKKNRKAQLLKASGKSEMAKFWATPQAGGMMNTINESQNIQFVKDTLEERDVEKKLSFSYDAWTVSLETVLMAMGNPVVDLLSLDVEGGETRILRTIPFDKVTIKLIMLEYNQEERILNEFIDILKPHGYEIVHFFYVQDVLFSLIHPENLTRTQ